MYTDILKINCAVFYITSVKFIIRNVCTEHIYCLQDVLKKVCRVYCLQGVFKKRLQGVVKKIVCRVQKKSWAAGCRSAGCHVRLSAQTKRSSAGCILGLVMLSPSQTLCITVVEGHGQSETDETRLNRSNQVRRPRVNMFMFCHVEDPCWTHE